jgi:hypothetical protein
MELSIEDWGTVRPKCPSDYELEESDFDPSGDRPEVHVRFLDSRTKMDFATRCAQAYQRNPLKVNEGFRYPDVRVGEP